MRRGKPRTLDLMAARAAVFATLVLLAGTASAQVFNVSLVQLIANPDRYDRKPVQVTGYCSLEFEGLAIYLHRDDERYGNTKNAVWLDLSEDLLRTAEFRKGHCLVKGVFNAKDEGHMGLFSGALTEIDRMEAWPPYPVRE